ncbi:DNA (cytosine-5)-methyltransferase DRM2 [Brachypodium distachyon]|uniref:DNA (cytosine-5)-methyltransferase DRM2 n=1 Tax=Brachypodium distachyon TaxID=15368 RepID=UPI0001C70809|nr:DNA (cytosine-5)-methyltransferase DRM2 [Brachypodium distachyon]|eukprot:XP_010237197.1 DNA (cytosine-5)-methyltransferase DRM2 [Brachypodium distachyon]
MVDCISDSDDSAKFEWESDNEAEPSSAPVLRNFDAPGPSTDANGWANGDAPSTSLVEEYVGMGFPKEMVLKAIKEIGHNDANALLELLLTYKVLGEDPTVGNCSTLGCAPQSVEDDDDGDLDSEDWDDEDDADGGEPNFDSSGDEDFLQEMSEHDKKIKSLVDMGFPEDESNMAIVRCGVDAALTVLVDSIYASQAAGDCNSRNSSHHEVCDSFGGRRNKKKRKQYGGGAQGNRPSECHEELMPLPNPMVGFSLPTARLPSVSRRLPKQATGPPFFYYENVALAPKGVWTIISRNLYDIAPEFVDSKYMCATARKRGYVHNLPIENRSPLLPLPPKTIFEAFPHYKKWWPSWDPRRQLNCVQTCVSSAKLTERIQCALARSGDPPPLHVQKYVMHECRKWNLVWVGKNKVAPLEPDEMEYLLGYPRDHTRGIGKTARYKCLGNSFQVDTVAYHLSVLRDIFPNGLNVLSLFTGIGGGEVALHRLGIHMKTVVSVEISEVNRRILRGWWDQTQTGTLIEIPDVQSFTSDKIRSFIRRFGGFDLIIGGSPCNNLAGSNRHHRDGLEGEHSSLFYHYPRILDTVKDVMAGM